MRQYHLVLIFGRRMYVLVGLALNLLGNLLVHLRSFENIIVYKFIIPKIYRKQCSLQNKIGYYCQIEMRGQSYFTSGSSHPKNKSNKDSRYQTDRNTLYPVNNHQLENSKQFQRESSRYLGAILHESIQNIHREEDSIVSSPYENKEIVLLREALIEKHNKLLVEIDTRNQLSEKISSLEREMSTSQHELGQQIRMLRDTLEKQRRRFQMKSQEEHRSLQDKISIETSKSEKLKKDLQTLRAKVLEEKMVNNNLEGLNSQLRETIQQNQKQLQGQRQMLKGRDSHIEYLNKQLDLVNTKLQDKSEELEDAHRQIQNCKQIIKDKTYTIENELSVQLKKQRQKFKQITQELLSMKMEQEHLLENVEQQFKRQIQELEKDLRYQKRVNLEKEQKNLQELKNLNILFKEKDREIQALRKRPVSDLEAKKKKFQVTKDLIQKLEIQEQGDNGGKTRNGRSPINSRTGKNSPYERTSSHSKNKGYKNIHLNNSTTGKKQGKDDDDRVRQLTNINNIEEMETTLLNCNMERKKIMAEIERIQQTQMQTRQIIGKRRRLQEELQYQEQKIRKVKQELKKMRLM